MLPGVFVSIRLHVTTVGKLASLMKFGVIGSLRTPRRVGWEIRVTKILVPSQAEGFIKYILRDVETCESNAISNKFLSFVLQEVSYRRVIAAIEAGLCLLLSISRIVFDVFGTCASRKLDDNLTVTSNR